jgi:hypothetical protein
VRGNGGQLHRWCGNLGFGNRLDGGLRCRPSAVAGGDRLGGRSIAGAGTLGGAFNGVRRFQGLDAFSQCGGRRQGLPTGIGRAAGQGGFQVITQAGQFLQVILLLKRLVDACLVIAELGLGDLHIAAGGG